MDNCKEVGPGLRRCSCPGDVTSLQDKGELYCIVTDYLCTIDMLCMADHLRTELARPRLANVEMNVFLGWRLH